MLDLASVFCRIEVPLRFGDQAIGAEPPLLKAGDSDPLSGSSGSSIRTCERPLINDLVPMVEEIVHHDHQIGEGGHKALCGLANRLAAERRRTAIDGERSPGEKNSATLGAF